MLNSKVCLTCGKTKAMDEFHNSKTAKNGKSSSCMVCSNAYSREWQRKHRLHMNAMRRSKYKRDPQIRISHYGRCTLNKVITGKKNHFKFLVECGAGNRKVLMDHLESTIPAGYTIADYGTKKWEGKLCVDHIEPCVSFNLEKREDYLKCFHYKNLRLVLKNINAKKASKKGFSYAHESQIAK
jgi:hypothetical protein